MKEQDDLMVIEKAPNGNEVINSAHETSPDVIVMNVNMPGMNGVQATQEIKSAMPNGQVIGLSFHDDDNGICVLSVHQLI